MTNKLKENWKEIINTAIKNKDPHHSFELFEGLIKQAKLSQKQEDDERFEEFIKRLKTSLCLGDWDVAGKDDCVMCKTVDKIAEELNGEKNK